MENKRAEKLSELVKAALGLATAERVALLDQACAGDDELRREVESLLAYESATDGLIETSALKLAARQLAVARREFTAGDDVNHYRIVKPLGAGGMGKVYLAEDTRLQRPVAIKFLTEDFAADSNRARRFEREALTVSALRHPNIITIHEHFNHEGLYLLVTEFVEGETLRQIIERGALDWREVITVAAQIAAALNAAHTAGIVHRDIKPENVIRQPDGHVKVLDFGIAKHLEKVEQASACSASEQAEACSTFSVARAEQTRTGQFFYTPGYASPAQARGERELDGRTDVFSLGVMMFEMLTGQRPFPGATAQEKIAALLTNQEAPDVRELCPDIPAALAVLIAKAICKGRAQRYYSAGEMLVELQELRGQIDTTDLGRVQQSLKKQNANRLLTLFTVLYLKNDRVRLPLGKLATVWWAADLPRGKSETELLRKSLRRGLLALAGWTFGLLSVAVAIAASLSITEVWGERILRDGHKAAVRRAVFSPDGRWLFSVGEDKQVIVWDFARRSKHRVFKDHADIVTALTVSPNGRWFATGSNDKTVIVWDAQSFEKVMTLGEHRDPVRALAFSPDSQSLVSVSSIEFDNVGQTIVWRAGQWRKVWEFPAGQVVGNLLFSPDSRLLMTPFGRWDLIAGEKLPRSENETWGNWVEFSPDGKMMVLASPTIYFFSLSRPGDVAGQKLIHRERAHQDFGRAVAFSPDGKLVATGSDDIVVWETATRKIWARWSFDAIVWSLTFSPDGKWLVSTHSDGSILLWNIARMDRAANLNNHIKGVRAVAISPDQTRIASASEDRSVIVWNVARGEKEMVLQGHDTRVTGVAFSPDGKWLASADQDGMLIRWDLERQQPSWKVKPVNSATVSVAISPEGPWLATSRGVHHADDGRDAFRFSDKAQTQVCGEGVDFSADGRKLVCVGVRGICVFNTGDWRIAARRDTESLSLISVAFSPDSRKIATGNLTGTVMLWDAESLQPAATIGQHGARLKAMAFSPDGQSVVSVGDATRIRMWDVSWRRSFFGGWLKRDADIGTHTAPVLAIAFSPDGQRLVSGEHDKSVRVYTRYRSLWGKKLDESNWLLRLFR